MESFRKTIKSVTCFLKYEDEYLFVHRTKKGNSVDANRLNGIGGKLESQENYLDAAIRETKEETGYIVDPKQCRLSGIVTLENGYPEDWVMCFFVIEVPTKEIPNGLENDEGTLIWMHKDEVLNSKYELVDDLNFCWNDICNQDKIFFAAPKLNSDEKIIEWKSTDLGLK